MKKSKELAKKNWKGSGDSSEEAIWFSIKDKAGPTEFLGYESNQSEGIVSVSYTHLTLPTNREV